MIHKEYSLIQKISLFYLLLKTKILFRNARLIRFPFYLRGKKYLLYGSGLTIGRHNRFEILKNNNIMPLLNIGKNVQFNDFNHIGCMKSINIGDNCLFGSRITIIDHNHGNYNSNNINIIKNVIDKSYFINPIKIGNNVWVGDNVVILPGTVLGNNVVVGAGSVVKGVFPDNSLLVGNPAILKKTYGKKT